MSQSMNIIGSSFQVDTVLVLPEDEVHLWRADLDGLGAEEFDWQALLSSDESARASRFHFLRDRQRFVAGRALLRKILAGYLSYDPAKINFSYSKREKPSLGGPHSASKIKFNLSHSGGIALFAFTLDREIGVDVEQIRSDSDLEAISRRFFSPHEQQELESLPLEQRTAAFYRCWTRKEAYIKATGDGLALPLNQFDVSLQPADGDALLQTRPDSSEALRWRLQEVPAGSGYTAALCAQGKNWRLKDWRSVGGT